MMRIMRFKWKLGYKSNVCLNKIEVMRIIRPTW